MERATRQLRPLLKQVTSRLKLPTHRWKRSFELGAFSGDANANSLPPAKKYLFANVFHFKSEEGDEATSPSFENEMRGLMLPACCWKRSLQRNKCSGDAHRSGIPQQANICLSIFSSLQMERATRQRRPLFQLQTRGMILPARCWKRSLQQSKCNGDANGSGLSPANNYLFADLFLFMSGEGDEATSPSFTTRYAAIDASKALLEALIANLLPACGLAKEATFPTAIRLLIAIGSLVACTDGEWATTPSCVSMGAYNALFQARIHRSMHVARIPSIGNTHLPRRATGPLWCPPCGHFFPSLRSNYPSRSGYIRVVVPFWFPSKFRPFPGSPSCSSPSARGSPFISPGPGARQTHLPPPDAPAVAHRAWTKSRSFAMPHAHLW